MTAANVIQPVNLAHEGWGAHLNGNSPSNSIQFHEASNSDDHIPPSHSSDESEQDYYNQYALSLMNEQYATDSVHYIHDTNDDSQYMVLYNGNAEVVGNFRALNFYKASDINIKEDVRLIMEDHDPRDVLLKISGVSYKFKSGTTHSTNKRFVGYIAQQIESVVPEAVQLIDGILHVDYESLIPYLSESIKQNFDDIKRSHADIDSIKSEQDHIRELVDMLYNTFLQRDRKCYTDKRYQNEGQQSSPKRWPRVMLVLLGVVFTLSAVLVGLYFVLDHNMSGNTPDSKYIPLTPITSQTPSTSLDPFNTDVDRHALEDLYYATNGPFWNLNSSAAQSKWLSDKPMCSWFGIRCLEGRVRSITLVGVTLQGTIPDSIGNLTLLDTLYLIQNNLTGTIPNSIGNLTSLQYLSLAQNNLSGTIPNSIRKLHSLDYFNLEKNPNLSGTIPDVPMMISSLFFSQCSLNGTIPRSMTTMQGLTNLMLDHNQLSGTIPPLLFLVRISNQVAIDLSNNLFEGTLPSFHSDFISPRISLDVSNNFLNGTLQNLASVQFGELILHNNQFSGEVGYFDTSTLTYLDISSNNFTLFSREAELPQLAGLTCRASNNPFQCPIPHWAEQNCNATCI